MNAVSSLQSVLAPAQANMSGTQNTATRLLAQSIDHGAKGDAKSTFQDFAGGTFYKEMLKSLHKTHGKPAYFHGGQAEKIFQGQLDQQIGEDLAHSHGSQFTDSLYHAFANNSRT